jgi:hypothetical protein
MECSAEVCASSWVEGMVDEEIGCGWDDEDGYRGTWPDCWEDIDDEELAAL